MGTPQPIRPGMEERVFIGRYRVATTKNAQWWEARSSPFSCEAEEVGSGKKILLELVPLLSLGAGEREERERTAAAALRIRHPNIPLLYAFGIENRQMVYALEQSDGPNAESWVADDGAMPIASALGIALQVTSAWRAMGEHAIPLPSIHPGNLIILAGQTTFDGCPLIKLADPLRLAIAPGCAPFASPEQLAGAPSDFRSNVYSLGATLYFLLSGAAPAARADGVVRPVEIPGVPEHIIHLLARMLAKNRDERPLDSTALELAIQGCLSSMESEETLRHSVAAFPLRAVLGAERPLWQRAGVTLVAAAAPAAILALACSALIDTTTAIKSGKVFASANVPLPARQTTGSAHKVAMNFPSASRFDRGGDSQIQSLAQLLGPTAGLEPAPMNEPAPPEEGPSGPMVEIVTKSAVVISAKPPASDQSRP